MGFLIPLLSGSGLENKSGSIKWNESNCREGMGDYCRDTGQNPLKEALAKTL